MPTRDDIKELEASTRRPVGGTVEHPDSCDPLAFRGVDFKVQPLRPVGTLSFRVSFTGGEADINASATVNEDQAPLAAMADIVCNGTPYKAVDACPTCGRSDAGVLAVDLDRHQEFLTALVRYAAAVLRQQYDLADSQLAMLLSFDGPRLPAWVGQIIRHAHGLTTVEPKPLPDAVLNRIAQELASTGDSGGDIPPTPFEDSHTDDTPSTSGIPSGVASPRPGFFHRLMKAIKG